MKKIILFLTLLLLISSCITDYKTDYEKCVDAHLCDICRDNSSSIWCSDLRRCIDTLKYGHKNLTMQVQDYCSYLKT